jgi:hypothetical protein
MDSLRPESVAVAVNGALSVIGGHVLLRSIAAHPVLAIVVVVLGIALKMKGGTVPLRSVAGILVGLLVWALFEYPLLSSLFFVLGTAIYTASDVGPRDELHAAVAAFMRRVGMGGWGAAATTTAAGKSRPPNISGADATAAAAAAAAEEEEEEASATLPGRDVRTRVSPASGEASAERNSGGSARVVAGSPEAGEWVG